MKSVINLRKANFKGPVSDLSIKGFNFSESYSGVSGALSGRLSGLPDIDRMTMDFMLDNLGFTTEGLGLFIRGFAPGAAVDLSKFASGTQFLFNGEVKGTLNNLKANGNVTSALGSLTADVNIRDLIKKGKAIGLGGNVSARNLNVGRLAGVKQVGEVTLRGAMDVSLDKGRTSLVIDTLSVEKLSALGYDYSNIIAAGTYSDNAFDGRIVCSDPNLNFLFQGLFTLRTRPATGSTSSTRQSVTPTFTP